jgi:hypothetical protein
VVYVIDLIGLRLLYMHCSSALEFNKKINQIDFIFD